MRILYFAVNFVVVAVELVGVADQIEPVPGPPLPISGRGEEPVDDPGEGIGGPIREESLGLVRPRRQAGQVKLGFSTRSPWHSAHRSTRTGRMDFSKNSIPSGASPARACRARA